MGVGVSVTIRGLGVRTHVIEKGLVVLGMRGLVGITEGLVE
jgi:hypothetical protein